MDVPGDENVVVVAATASIFFYIFAILSDGISFILKVLIDEVENDIYAERFYCSGTDCFPLKHVFATQF